jgi:hypothetical protein
MAVRLEGAVALRKALRKFEPDLSKEVQKEIASFLKPVVKEARGYLPNNSSILSNWSAANKKDGTKFPYYDFSIAKRGITYKTSPSKTNRRGFRALASIFNKTAAGAIYETAGRKNPDSTFVKNLNAKYPSKMVGKDKMQGRAMFRAYEENEGKAQDGVIRAIEKAAAKFKAATNV